MCGHTNTHNHPHKHLLPPPVIPHFRKSTSLPSVLYHSLLGPWLAQMALQESMHSSGKASNRNQVQQEGKKTKRDFSQGLFSPGFLGVLCWYFHSEHASQQGRGSNVCPPKQWGDLGEGKCVIVAGTHQQPENTQKGCGHATVDIQAGEQTHKTDKSLIRTQISLLFVFLHTQTCREWCKLPVLSVRACVYTCSYPTVDCCVITHSPTKDHQAKWDIVPVPRWSCFKSC